MKRVLGICESLWLSESIVEYCDYLNQRAKIQLTVAFQPSPQHFLQNSGLPVEEDINLPESFDHEGEQLEQVENLYSQYCRRSGLPLKYLKDNELTTVSELLTETGFSDLAVTNGRFFFRRLPFIRPNCQMQYLLLHGKCPVLLVPETFSQPENLVLIYDGSTASLEAIRSFDRFWPLFENLPVFLLVIGLHGKDHLSPEPWVSLLSGTHLTSAKVIRLNQDLGKTTPDWWKKLNNPIIVAGIYPGSPLPLVFSRSFLEPTFSNGPFPVFLFHN